MSDENQLPATVPPAAPPAPRKKRERKTMTQQEMKVAAQTLGCSEAAVMQWTALAEVGRGIAQMGKRNTGVGITMDTRDKMLEQLASVTKRLESTEDPEQRLKWEALRLEYVTRIGALGSNLMKDADKEPKAPDAPPKEVTRSFPIHPPVQVNISTQPSSDVKVVSNGSHLGSDSETDTP